MLAVTNPVPRWWETLNDARRSIRDKIHFRRPTIRRNPALKWQGGNDYRLENGHNTTWIQIDDHSVYVRKTEKGIAVEIINHGEGGELITVAEAGILIAQI